MYVFSKITFPMKYFKMQNNCPPPLYMQRHKYNVIVTTYIMFFILCLFIYVYINFQILLVSVHGEDKAGQ